MKLKAIQLLPGVFFSATALYVVLHDVRWSAVSNALGNVNYALVALAAGFVVASVALRAVRWRVLLQPAAAPYGQALGSLYTGYFLNNVLPLQLGDLARAYILSELAGLSTTRVLSSVLVERVVDILTLLLILLAIAPVVDIPTWIRAPSLVLAFSFSCIAIALIASSSKRAGLLRLMDFALSVAPRPSRTKLRAMANSAVDGFGVLSDRSLAASILLVSTLIWLVTALAIYAGSMAFRLATGFDAALLILIVTTLGFFIPSTPGSFGVYHALVIATLTGVFDVEKEAAVSFALVMHLVFYLPPMICGPAFLWLERDLWRRTSFFAKLAELRGQPGTVA